MPSQNDIFIILVTITYYCAVLAYLYIHENKAQLFDEAKKIKICVIEKMNLIKQYFQKWDKGRILRFFFKNICYLGIFSWLIWCFENHWLIWFSNNCCKYINFSQGLANFLIVLCVFVLILLISLNRIYYRLIKWKGCIYTFLVITILYIRYRFCVDVFIFTEISIQFPISYIDILVLMYVIYVIISIIIDYKRKKYIENYFILQEPYYYHDAPIENLEEDKLNFTPLVNHLKDKIGTLTRKHSWSIAITGAWGSGKTSLINLMKTILSSDRYLFVSFNPRFISSTARIQENALRMLEEAVVPYDSSIRLMMRRYIYALQLDATSGFLQVILNCFKAYNTIDKIKDRLNRTLQNLPKQVVFIIEDFDRLTREEILEVLKLIDGNANFNNIIFVAAYDHAYVGTILASNSYIEKYFNIEIHVPLAIHDHMINYLNAELGCIFTRRDTDNVTLSSKEVLEKYFSLFSKYIVTMRDAKRYLNMLKSDILVINISSVVVEDFLLLELLKYLDANLYESIYLSPERYLIFYPKITTNNKSDNYKNLDEDKIYILKNLFPIDNANDRPYKIRNRDNFFEYFVQSSPNKEKLNLSWFFDSNIDESSLFDKVKVVIQENSTLKELLNLLDQYGRQYICDIASLKRYVYIILTINKLIGDKMIIPDARSVFKHSFYSNINVMSHLSINHQDMEKFILDFYNEKCLTRGDAAVLSTIIPELYGTVKDDIVVNSEAIKDIVHKNFDIISNRYIHTNLYDDFKLLLKIFYLCIDRIDVDSKIYIEENYCQKMKRIIEQSPFAYIYDFVRLGAQSSSKDVNWVACEPFWKQIFGSETEMKRFIHENDNSTNPRFIRVANFWSLYEANNYEMIEFNHQGNVQEIIDNDLKQQIQYLNELHALEKQLPIIAKELNVTTRNEKIADIKNHIEEIPLNIIYKGELLQKVMNITNVKM